MNLKSIAHYLVIFGVVLTIIALGNLGGGQAAWASNGAQACVPGTIPCPTPTPAPPTPTPKPSGGGGSQPATTGSIVGQVLDLSTGLPGIGVTVRINDVDVMTDETGSFALRDLSAGDYLVSLVLVGDAVSAQEPVVVHVDGNEVQLGLQYYSAPSVGGVVTTTATITTTISAPTFLPETGGGNSTRLWGLLVGVLGLIMLGASQICVVRK